MIIIIIIILLLLLSQCSCFNTRNLTNINTNKTNNHKIINTDLNNDLNTDTNTNTNVNTNTNTNDNNQENPWPDLSGCVNGLLVDYHSTVKATNETEAGEIFQEYISWAQINHKEIFFGKGNRWQFQSAKPHGIYQGTKYWRITALWFSEIKQQWLPQIIFDVSENGQVVRMLGCL